MQAVPKPGVDIVDDGARKDAPALGFFGRRHARKCSEESPARPDDSSRIVCASMQRTVARMRVHNVRFRDMAARSFLVVARMRA